MHTKNSNNTIKVSIEQNTRTQNTKYIHRTTTTTNKTKHFQISDTYYCSTSVNDRKRLLSGDTKYLDLTPILVAPCSTLTTVFQSDGSSNVT